MDRIGGLRAALALVGIAACSAPALPPVVHVFPLRDRTLPSGLRVVIEQDDTSKMAGVSWVVDVGQVDSPVGRPELAHAVEHLLLGAPDTAGVSAWERLNALGAVNINGVTSTEETMYEAFVPAEALDQLVAIELGRMADPLQGATPELWARERNVIGEELDLKSDSRNVVGTHLLMAALFPPSSVLGRDLVRTREALKDVSLADLREFAATYYRPERMTLVISGPISADWDARLWPTMPLVLYGEPNTKRTPVRRPVAAASPAPNPVTTLVRQNVAVGEPGLWTGWVLPPARGIAAVSQQALGDVAETVLRQALENGELPDATAVSVGVGSGALASTLVCRVALRPGADPAAVEERVKKYVASLADLREGYSPRFYQPVLRLGVLRAALGMESLTARTEARAYLVHDDPDASIGAVVLARRKVSVDDIGALASRYLAAGAARSVALLPLDAGGKAPRATDRAEGPRAQSADHPGRTELEGEDATEHEDTAGGAKRSVLTVAKAPGARAASVSRLSNGLTLIVLPRPGLPFASMVLGFHAEPTPDDAPGARIAALFARRQRARLSAQERGLLQSVWRDRDSYREQLSLFADDFEQALLLVEDETDTMYVKWPSPAFERWGARAAIQESTEEWRASRSFEEALWGNHPYGAWPRAEIALKVSPSKVEEWLERVYRPHNGALVVVGNVDPAEVARRAEHQLDGWKDDRKTEPTPPPALEHAGPLHVGTRVDVTPASRATTTIHFGCLLPPAHAPRDTVVNRLFSEIVDRDMFRRLRIELGETYAPSVRAASLRGGTAWMEGELDVARGASARALDVVHAWLDVGAPVPYDGTAVERTRWRLARRSNLLYDTNEKLARLLFDAWKMGWEPATLDDYPAALAGVAAADLTRALETCRASAVVSLVGRAPLPSPSNGPG